MKTLPELSPTFAEWLAHDKTLTQVLNGLTEGLDEDFDHFTSQPRALLLSVADIEPHLAEASGWPTCFAGLHDLLVAHDVRTIPCLSVFDRTSETRSNLRMALPITDRNLIEGIKGRVEEFDGNIYVYKISNNFSYWQ